jgi:hypothetical protein
MALNSLSNTSELDTNIVIINNELFLIVVFWSEFFLYKINGFLLISFYFLTDITKWKILQIWLNLGIKNILICFKVNIKLLEIS